MTQPVSITGKANVLASINTWLQANVPNSLGFTYFFDQALDPAVFPAVNAYEYRFFDPGDSALGGIIFPANTANTPAGPTEGSAQRMIIALDMYTDGSADSNALLVLRKMRDWFMYALKNAGVVNDLTGVVLVPPVIITDVNGTGLTTNLVARWMTEQDNWAVENNTPPSAPGSQIFKYQILARVEWYEMR